MPNLHFVVTRLNQNELDDIGSRKVGVDYPYWLGGPVNWACQTYLQLRDLRNEVTIGRQVKPNALNIAHVTTWEDIGKRAGEYRISIRADYRRLYDVDFEILQNPREQLNPNQGYICYWPVPGIIPRPADRVQVENLAYAGRHGGRNIDDFFKKQINLPDGQAMHVRHIPKDKWHDFSSNDVMVAVRSFSRHPYPDKPPSKLINAWLARVPLIAGYDSSYSQIGSPGKDYLRVSSPEEFIECLDRLRDPAFYHSIVAAGAEKSVAFTPQVIARQWLELLEGKISRHYGQYGPSEPVRRFVHSNLDRSRRILGRIRNKFSA